MLSFKAHLTSHADVRLTSHCILTDGSILQGGDALSSEKEAAPAKAANKFEMLTLEE